MDFGALPPEINSGRMYCGPGSGPMLAAAAAWDGVAVELGLAATGYASVIAELTGAPWVGAASLSMVAAATPYVAWLSQAAARAEQAGMQAAAAAAAYEAAFVITVPPPVITANRVLVMTLIATNFSVRTRRRSRSLRRSTPKCGRKTPLLCMAMRLRRRARRG